MRRYGFKFQLFATLGLVCLAAACDSQRPVSAESTPSHPKSSNATVDPTAAQAAVPVSDCTANSCPPLALTFKLVDMKTGGDIDLLQGYTNTPITWGIKVVPKDGSSTARSVLLNVLTPPSELEVAHKANTVVIIGSFVTVQSSNLSIRYRDADYCKLHHAPSSDCDDINTSIGDVDKTDSVPYTVLQSAQDQQRQSQTTMANKQNCISGLFSVFFGNISGIAGCAGSVLGGMH